MLITNSEGNFFNNKFSELASSSNNITIASGYFGATQLEEVKPIFLNIVKKGGEVKLIHGMGMWEGVRKSLDKSIKNLNQDLQALSPKSGFYFYTKQRFHGKIYLFENQNEPICIVGSSNFSKNGLQNNLEANLLQNDKKILGVTKKFLSYLLKQSLRYDEVSLPDKGIAQKSKPLFRKTPLDNYKVPSNIKSLNVDFTIPIRFQPKSNLNLTFGAGRKNKKGFYDIRPYYEVEITIPKNQWSSPLTNFVPNQKEPSIFEIFTDNNLYFESKFKRKAPNKKDQRGIHQTGGDFMSNPREALGKFVKDKLIQAGVLQFGELITDETLSDYGNDKLLFKKLDGQRLYVEF